jgi:hypothetical protein
MLLIWVYEVNKMLSVKRVKNCISSLLKNVFFLKVRNALCGRLWPTYDPLQRPLQDGQEGHRQQHRPYAKGCHSGIDLHWSSINDVTIVSLLYQLSEHFCR